MIVHDAPGFLCDASTGLGERQYLRTPINGLADDEVSISQASHERSHVRTCDAEQSTDLALRHSGIGSDHQKYGRLRRAQVKSCQPHRKPPHERRRHAPKRIAGKVFHRITDHVRISPEIALALLALSK